MWKVKQTTAAQLLQLLQLSQRIAQHLVVVFVILLCSGSWLPFCFESHKKECRLLLSLLLLLLLLLLLWPATCASLFFCFSSLFLYFASARNKSHSKKTTQKSAQLNETHSTKWALPKNAATRHACLTLTVSVCVCERELYLCRLQGVYMHSVSAALQKNSCWPTRCCCFVVVFFELWVVVAFGLTLSSAWGTDF